MTDARKTGPFGEGGEAQPITVDLTRIDIRRGTLYLPRRFYGALPEGELQAADAAAGKMITVTFEPPRQLEGLGPFYEEHDLRPNDAVSLNLSDGLQLTPIRRERRQAASGTPAESREASVPDRQPSAVYGQKVYDGKAHEGKAHEGKGVWQDVLHDPTPRPHPGGFSKPEAAPRVPAPPVPRADEPALVEPPFDAGSGEARHVAPRDLSRLGLGRERSASGERSRTEESEPAGRRSVRSDLERLRPEFMVQQHERIRRERQEAGRAGQFGSGVREEEAAEGFLVREKPAREGRSAPIDARPLAPAGGESQQGLFESPADERTGAGRQEQGATQRGATQQKATQQRPAAQRPVDQRPVDADRTDQRSAEKHSAEGNIAAKHAAQQPAADQRASEPVVAARPLARPQPEPAPEHEEREPVMVGAGGEGAAFGRISRYLADPGTPAIVRAEAVAEVLNLPVDATKQGLAEAARASEGSITAIRPDVYLVKRNR